MRNRLYLFRWWRHTQLDVRLRSRYLSLGLDWRRAPRLIAYVSPDATPCHALARGLGAEARRG